MISIKIIHSQQTSCIFYWFRKKLFVFVCLDKTKREKMKKVGKLIFLSLIFVSFFSFLVLLRPVWLWKPHCRAEEKYFYLRRQLSTTMLEFRRKRAYCVTVRLSIRAPLIRGVTFKWPTILIRFVENPTAGMAVTSAGIPPVVLRKVIFLCSNELASS